MQKMTIRRRDFLTGLFASPMLGARSGNAGKNESPAPVKPVAKYNPVRLGLIGYGSRGEELVHILGKAELNIEFRGISEVFDQRMEKGLAAAGSGARGYKNYRDLLDADDIDAVIIATPDHWHARIATDAANRGKHIYLEKCMACSVEDAVILRNTVKSSGVVFQLGHQGRQRDLNLKARELAGGDILGRITLIETTTNRNDARNGWKKLEGELASNETIDWEMFQGPGKERYPFSLERYYGWRNYWAYGIGMAGELLTNEFDMVNSIMNLGIPESAVASGGLYDHSDGREVPDLFQAALEYPARSLTLLYSGTLANGIPRGTLFMGRDATMELGRILSVWADKSSIRYRSRIEAGILDPATPIVNYMKDQVDAISSATSKYYADRGLVSTYREGKQLDTTGLHLAEWLQCIHSNRLPSCSVDRGFEEAVTASMATIAYREGRKVRWDRDKETII
jgi:predicted dehydrogenase